MSFWMAEDKVIWQSKFFPKMVLTQSHLEILRYAYPSIKKFEPRLREAEAWLYSNPHRQPARNWKRFITNWMRKSVEIEQERQARHRTEQGEAAARTPNAPRALADILKKVR